MLDSKSRGGMSKRTVMKKQVNKRQTPSKTPYFRKNID
jgi:hypothetical protein